MTDIQTGDSVTKPEGYAFPGLVLGVFETLAGKQRVVVENLDVPDLLHIFRPEQLQLDERGKLYSLRLAKSHKGGG